MRNQIIRILPFASTLILAIGLFLAFASFFGLFDTGLGSIFLYGGALLSAFSAIYAGISFHQLNRELEETQKIADRLAEGDISVEIFPNSPVKTSLKAVSDYILTKTQTVDQIAKGDIDVQIITASNADVLGLSLQNMIDNLRAYIQPQHERDNLQNSIMKLLEEVSEVAEGDLTVEAEVTPEITGAIADAFNYMTAELRSLIRQVKEVTFQVGSSANAITETTAQLAQGSEAQASQITRTTTAVERMNLQIQEISQSSTSSSQVAEDSLNTARYGNKAVHDNINAMNRIRKQVQETAKRIKKLGERSQEISQIVQLIDDLSERTSLLALNASLQAAAAGEQGRGFVIVAEEVERLAERSNRATQQIVGLTQAIQFETKEVVASMEETIHEVVVGSALADKAGQALVEIEKVTQKLAALIQSISEAAKNQATSSEDITRAMVNISKVTELVNSSSKKAVDSMKMLVLLADELRNSVAPFKLPEEKTGKIKKFALPDTTGSGFYLN